MAYVGNANADRDADLDLMNEEFMRMLQGLLTQLKREMLSVDPSQKFADRQVVVKMRELGAMLKDASERKIKMARAAKLLSQVLTPEQRLEETIKYIGALPGSKRYEIIQRLVKLHTNNAEANSKKHVITAMDRMKRLLDGDHDRDELDVPDGT